MTQQGPVHSLNIPEGNAMLLELAGLEGQVKCAYAGCEPGMSVIISVPQLQAIRSRFKPGARVVMRWVDEGVIHGFKASVVVYLVTEELRYVVLTWPEAVEQKRIKAADTVPAFIPARLEAKGRAVEGLVVWIGQGGLGFCSPAMKDRHFQSLGAGAEVAVTMPLLGLEGPQRIACLAGSVITHEQLPSLDLMYQGITKEQTQAVTRLIGFIALCRQHLPTR